MATVVKIVELMGVSENSFSEAVQNAVKEASKSIRNITGVEVIKSTAEVEGDEIFEYHVTVRLAFAIERGQSAGDAGQEEEQPADEDEKPPADEEDEEQPADEEDEEQPAEDEEEGEEEEERR